MHRRAGRVNPLIFLARMLTDSMKTSPMQPDDLLCYCFHVTHRKVMNHTRIHQPTVASQLSECGGAGTGCGWCVPFLKKHFEASHSQSEALITVSADEYAARRNEYLQEKKTARMRRRENLSDS